MKGKSLFALTLISFVFVALLFAATSKLAVADNDTDVGSGNTTINVTLPPENNTNSSEDDSINQTLPPQNQSEEFEENETGMSDEEENESNFGSVVSEEAQELEPRKGREFGKHVRERAKELRMRFKEEWEKAHKMNERVEEIREKYELKKDELRKIEEEVKKKHRRDLPTLKKYLVKHIDVYQHYVAVLISYLENGTDVNDSVNDSDAYLARLEEIYVQLDDLRVQAENATNKSELKQIALEVRDLWKETKEIAKDTVGVIVKNRLRWAIKKAEKVSERWEKLIARLQERGVDTTKLEKKLNKFNSEIEEAKQLLREAATKFREAANTDDVQQRNQLRREAQKLVHQAKEKVKSAFKELKEVEFRIRKEFKGRVSVQSGGDKATIGKEVKKRFEAKKGEIKEKVKRKVKERVRDAKGNVGASIGPSDDAEADASSGESSDDN